QPPIVYANIARMGVEWHGSRGDLLQEQDDVDLAELRVDSRAIGASAVAAQPNRDSQVVGVSDVVALDRHLVLGQSRTANQQSSNSKYVSFRDHDGPCELLVIGLGYFCSACRASVTVADAALLVGLDGR
ncbi:MAG: hypothetical protein RLN69_11815, partial [Woeseiaceae bacterium]